MLRHHTHECSDYLPDWYTQDFGPKLRLLQCASKRVKTAAQTTEAWAEGILLMSLGSYDMTLPAISDALPWQHRIEVCIYANTGVSKSDEHSAH